MQYKCDTSVRRQFSGQSLGRSLYITPNTTLLHASLYLSHLLKTVAANATRPSVPVCLLASPLPGSTLRGAAHPQFHSMALMRPLPSCATLAVRIPAQDSGTCRRSTAALHPNQACRLPTRQSYRLQTLRCQRSAEASKSEYGIPFSGSEQPRQRRRDFDSQLRAGDLATFCMETEFRPWRKWTSRRSWSLWPCRWPLGSPGCSHLLSGQKLKRIPAEHLPKSAVLYCSATWRSLIRLVHLAVSA